MQAAPKRASAARPSTLAEVVELVVRQRDQLFFQGQQIARLYREVKRLQAEVVANEPFSLPTDDEILRAFNEMTMRDDR